MIVAAAFTRMSAETREMIVTSELDQDFVLILFKDLEVLLSVGLVCELLTFTVVVVISSSRIDVADDDELVITLSLLAELLI